MFLLDAEMTMMPRLFLPGAEVTMSDTKPRAIAPKGRDDDAVRREISGRSCHTCATEEGHRLRTDLRGVRSILAFVGGGLLLFGVIGFLQHEVASVHAEVLEQEVRHLRAQVEEGRRDTEKVENKLDRVLYHLHMTETQVGWTGNDVVLLRNTLEEHFCQSGTRKLHKKAPCPFPLPVLEELPRRESTWSPDAVPPRH